jgi:hypothetical protein
VATEAEEVAVGADAVDAEDFSEDLGAWPSMAAGRRPSCEFHVSPRAVGCCLRGLPRPKAWHSRETFMSVQIGLTSVADSEWCT